MQDRIKELADEAHNATDHAMEDDPSLMDPDAWSDRMYMLFAQAVARECADIASDTIEQGGVLGHYSAQAIRARFGLGE